MAQRAKAPKAARAPLTEGDVRSLLDQGLYSFEEGDLDQAVAALEATFGKNPSDSALLDFVERVTATKIMRMLESKNARIRGLALQILESSSRAQKVKQLDPEAIRKAIVEVLGADGEVQLTLRAKYTGLYGRNLVPYLIPVLADSSLARRATAINWIGRVIGRDAIPVLQAARKHPDPTVRRNVAALLGSPLLRHPVCLATLKALSEDSSGEVKKTAQESLDAILAELNGKAKQLTAKEYFLENAILYYLEPHRNPFAVAYYTPMVFRLEGRNVVGDQVADFQVSERMAQQALEEALELDPGFEEAQVLTLCNDAQQVYEYDLNAAFYARDESNPQVKELLEKQKPYVDYILRNRVRMWPEKILYGALLQALEDGRSEVARVIIATIRETGRGGRVPEALVKALEDTGSRLTRIAAAVALAYWNPVGGELDAGEQVVSILGEAVVTSGVRTAQKVIGDNQLANRMEDILRSLNMESYSPIDTVERAVDAVMTSPPDVVIMDENVTKSTGKRDIAPVNHFVNELRKHYRSANVPVVVVVASGSLERAKSLYESEERKVWVVPDSVDRLALNNTVFARIFKDKDDAKAQATKLSVVAAEAINYLATVHTEIPVKKTVGALRQVLKNRPDEVRIPCIRALGNLRAAEAAGELAATFANAENAREVRVEAMRAVGMALSRASAAASPQVAKAIEDGLNDLDADLRTASWIAFSTSGADPARQLKTLLMAAPAAVPPAGAAAPEAPVAPAKEDAETPAEAEAVPEPAEEAPAEPAEENEPAPEGATEEGGQ
jgi:hypothetical protein